MSKRTDACCAESVIEKPANAPVRRALLPGAVACTVDRPGQVWHFGLGAPSARQILVRSACPHRLLQELSASGLNLSAGAVTGGLQSLASLFEPVEEALLSQLRSETHWRADETRWMVFIEVEGKTGHRWYLGRCFNQNR